MYINNSRWCVVQRLPHSYNSYKTPMDTICCNCAAPRSAICNYATTQLRTARRVRAPRRLGAAF
eukprot:9468357-Pyramimonas_sp.AAC.2